MTAKILMLLISILDPAVPVPAIKLPNVPTDAQILAEARKRANQFCTPDYVYPKGQDPIIFGCAQAIPNCDVTLPDTYPYKARCTGRI